MLCMECKQHRPRLVRDMWQVRDNACSTGSKSGGRPIVVVRCLCTYTLHCMWALHSSKQSYGRWMWSRGTVRVVSPARVKHGRCSWPVRKPKKSAAPPAPFVPVSAVQVFSTRLVSNSQLKLATATRHHHLPLSSLPFVLRWHQSVLPEPVR